MGIKVAATLGYENDSDSQVVRKPEFATKLTTELKKKSPVVFKEVQVSGVEVEDIQRSAVAETTASPESNDYMLFIIVGGALGALVIIVIVVTLCVCLKNNSGKDEPINSNTETPPPPHRNADNFATSIVNETTLEFSQTLTPDTHKESGVDTSEEGIELPSITSIPGAADLVNNIIDGVLGPDEADSSAVSDDAVLLHIAMQDLRHDSTEDTE